MPARSPATPSRMPPTSRPAPSMMLLTSSRTSPMMWPTSPQTLPRRADTTSRVELSACATKPMTPPSSSLTFTLTLASFMSASPAARRISTTNSLMLVRRFLVKLSTASSSVLRPSKRPFSPSMSVDSLYFATNASALPSTKSPVVKPSEERKARTASSTTTAMSLATSRSAAMKSSKSPPCSLPHDSSLARNSSTLEIVQPSVSATCARIFLIPWAMDCTKATMALRIVLMSATIGKTSGSLAAEPSFLTVSLSLSMI
mmetsp:Transcript_12971/g.43626  ORF Transcript_12971/g.43626 Transcript_12971/m.43626 type:complete len:259 (+) Transcript_12971:437-1213(+)